MESRQQVAGIALPSWAPEKWSSWFAPESQPFVIDDLAPEDRKALPAADAQADQLLDAAPGVQQLPPNYSAETRDSFWIYDKRPRIWLTEPEFDNLAKGLRTRLVRAQLTVHRSIGTVRKAPPAVRQKARIQVDGHRFIWWPSLIELAGLDPIIDLIEDGVRRRRHSEVPERIWQQAQDVLPAARELAGTSPEGSGPNCFGTVMAAAGVPGAVAEWANIMQWLVDWIRDHTRAGGQDDTPGTVLVWHDEQDVPVHAAVTIGGGWALNKASQSWSSPRFVWTVREVINHSRYKGCHLKRRTITG